MNSNPSPFTLHPKPHTPPKQNQKNAFYRKKQLFIENNVKIKLINCKLVNYIIIKLTIPYLLTYFITFMINHYKSWLSNTLINHTLTLTPSAFLKKVLYVFALFFLTATSWGQTFSIVGTGTSSSSSSYANPYNNGYWGNKTQHFVTAAQLTASGIAANASISQIGFNVTTAGTSNGANLSGFTIKVYTTTSTNPISSGFVTSTLVAQSTPTTLNVATTGWKMTSLSSSFIWDGTSNLIIETCFNNSAYTSGCTVQWTTSIGTGTWSRWFYADDSNVCSSTASSSSSTSSRPNIRFAWAAAVACSGTPSPGNTIASINPVPNGSTTDLSLQTSTSGSGVTYQWQSSPNNSTWTNVASGGTSATYSASPTTATYYRCNVTCSGNSGTSSSLLVNLTYCLSTGTSTTYYISNFTTTGGLSNINLTSTGASGGYINNASTYSCSQYPGTSINYSIGSIVGAGTGLSIFIDWNNNFLFTDSNEKVAGTSAYTSLNPYTGSFTVPAGTPPGNYRMRVVTDYNNLSPLSCNSGISGETEDYTFTVVAIPACSGTPTAGAISSGNH